MGVPTADLSHFLDPARILILAETLTKSALLERLCDALAASGVLEDPAVFRQAIKDREVVTSTGIGSGIAIPHARLTSITGFALAVAITPAGVDYGTRDGKPVVVTVMIASPEDERARHLQVLASVVSRLTQPAMRDALVAAGNAQDVIRLLSPQS